MNDDILKKKFLEHLKNGPMCPHDLAWKISRETEIGFGHVWNELIKRCNTGLLRMTKDKIYKS